MGRMDPMSRQRGSMLVRRLAYTTGLIAATCLLAACSSSGTTTASAASSATAGSGSSASGSASSAAPVGPFVAIVEPFDPGHPARTAAPPASCGGQASTVAIEQCYDTRTENADAAIDTVQLAHYTSSAASGKATILTQYSAWLAAREPVCAVAYHSGGTIDGINVAACLLDESTARLDAVKGIAPPVVVLKGTDSEDPSQLSFYTTPEGSRIAMINTQGDTTGGSIVAWVIIGGADGFVVNPKQFYFQDNSFIRNGVIQPPDPTDHRVATAQEYQFGLDYQHLDADPNASKSAAGYFYVPGYPAADWN